MSNENCTHDCSSCKEDCAERNAIPKESLNEFSKVRKVIGVVSGKGGVGKSMVTALLATASSRMGKCTAVLDADITGPSIPKLFGITEKVTSPDGKHITPAESVSGIKIISINLLLPDETEPVVWRGPIIAGTVKQFWTDVIWGDVDYMFVDMPPGTGDVPLTVFQSLPVDGIIVVASPQDLVSMIVAKAVKMAQIMNIPVLGIVENMSYLTCPHCGKKINLFGESHIDKTAREFGIKNVFKLPLDPALTALADSGKIEEADYNLLLDLFKTL